MKILILGGTGAMGADLVRILAKQDEDLTVTSRSARCSEFGNVRYVQGDARNVEFLKKLLKESYDAIIDFMYYNTAEFKLRRDLFLRTTKQYIFLSSSRVYANSEKVITEESALRLLDIAKDDTYLATDEYSLAKARQEDLLCGSGRRNWTIIRPYITYSSQRLQLGVYEKELWLYRALQNRTILFPKDIADRYTTMTLGEDVAWGISRLIGNEKAMGCTFHITSDVAIQWRDVLDIYKNVLKETMGKRIKIEYVDDAKPLYDVMGNKYQVIYDRFLDRRFDSKRFKETVGEYKFTIPQEGLERCLKIFLVKKDFKMIPWVAYGYMDKQMDENTPLINIPTRKDKLKYILARHTKYFEIRKKK